MIQPKFEIGEIVKIKDSEYKAQVRSIHIGKNREGEYVQYSIRRFIDEDIGEYWLEKLNKPKGEKN